MGHSCGQGVAAVSLFGLVNGLEPLLFRGPLDGAIDDQGCQESGQDRRSHHGVIQIAHDAEKSEPHAPQKNDHVSKSIFHPVSLFLIVRLLQPSCKRGTTGRSFMSYVIHYHFVLDRLLVPPDRFLQEEEVYSVFRTK